MAMTTCGECNKDVSDKATQCPNCGAPIGNSTSSASPIPKKKGGKLKWFIITIVLLGIIGALGGKKGSQETSTPPSTPISTQQAPTQPPTPEVEYQVMPATTLWKAFESNEISAEKKYKGKKVAIEGRIYSIESSIMGYPEIVFNVAHGINTVRCQFSKKDIDQIADMQKGQHIVVIGKVEGFTLGALLSLGDCTFSKLK